MATGESNRGWVPVPDPTKLTTDAVDRAKQDIERLFDVKLNSLERLVNEKTVSRDKAIAAAFTAASELYGQQNASNNKANDLAREATAKQIDALVLRIDDLKDRVAELGRKDWSTVGAYLVGAIGIVAAIIAALSLHH